MMVEELTEVVSVVVVAILAFFGTVMPLLGVWVHLKVPWLVPETWAQLGWT
jgi:hypothetical protein